MSHLSLLCKLPQMSLLGLQLPFLVEQMHWAAPQLGLSAPRRIPEFGDGGAASLWGTERALGAEPPGCPVPPSPSYGSN